VRSAFAVRSFFAARSFFIAPAENPAC
jgi:hypothetical protein